jgi:hypothetical protein
LKILKHGNEKISFEKFVLILNAGTLNKFSNCAETLGDSEVVLDVDKILFIFLALIFQDFPDASSDIEVG